MNVNPTPNLALPGNPRYQPKELKDYFGYDVLSQGIAQVEIAVLKMLGEIGVIPGEDMALFTPEVEDRLLAITTSQQDEVERKVTKHDIRAWVRLAQEQVDPCLRRWIHVPLTSYDAIDTGRSLQYLHAYRQVTRPTLQRLVGVLRDMAEKHAKTRQIGRSHGQAALPITVGFWLATILNRVLYSAWNLERASQELVGKICGAVGAANAIVGLGIKMPEGDDFEMSVLNRMGLKTSPICTQIVPPEPLANFLFQHLMLSAVFAQLGRDGRNLMRTEIGEIREEFEQGQVGSSTMAHKRNPINFENLEGMYTKSIGEFMKVLLTMISEHQRDLTGSAPARDFPILVINLHNQLNVLLRENAQGVPFLSRIQVDAEALKRNFEAVEDVVLAEPLYLALQMAGYEGDAHNVVNHRLMPKAQAGQNLIEALEEILPEDEQLQQAWGNVPTEVRDLLASPHKYIGLAVEKTLRVCERAEQYLALR